MASFLLLSNFSSSKIFNFVSAFGKCSNYRHRIYLFDNRYKNRVLNFELIYGFFEILVKFLAALFLERESAMEDGILTNIDVQLAYCAEKVQNLEIFQMNISNLELDSEKAFEIDLLSGYLDSELEELDHFIRDLLTEIESSCGVQEFNAEKSLKELQEQVAEIKNRSSEFQQTLRGKKSGVADEGESSLMDERQRRHVLHVLEESIARELDMEKKLDFLERESSYYEEATEDLLQKFFIADHTSVIMMDTSKKLILNLQEAQFSLNCSLMREKELKSKLQEAQSNLNSSLQREKEMLKSVEQVNSLKAAHKESEERFSVTMKTLKDQVNALQKDLESSVQRAENAEKRLPVLEEENSRLSRERNSMKNSFSLLNAQIEAISEERDTLRSSVADMETLIGDLKKRVFEAESKYSSSFEANSKLTKEASSMREKLGFLEGSLLQAKEAKHAAAVDFGIKAKIIHDLVLKLSSDRDRLQAEVFKLTKERNYCSAREKLDNQGKRT